MTTGIGNTLNHAYNSTNVRSKSSVPIWLRAGFSAGSQWAPGLTAVAGEKLFRKTRRREARPGERAILEGAMPMRVAGMKAWSWGDGPTVLLVHGWNGRSTQLGGFVPALVDLGYRVVAFDAFGHGDSPGSFMSLPELADCIREVVDELAGVYGIIAHSLGGAATTFAVSRGLEVERLVFISPPSDPREFLTMFSSELGISEEVRHAVERRIEHRLGVTMENMQATGLAPAMQTPLLVIHDRNDREVPVRAGQGIAESWPGSELIITEGLGHQRILRDQGVVTAAVDFIHATRSRQISGAGADADRHGRRSIGPGFRHGLASRVGPTAR